MSSKTHWSVKQFRELRPALGQYTNPMVAEMTEAAGEMEGYDLYFVEVATLFAPQPIGVAHIYKRSPYANPDGHKQRMEDSAQRGWLEQSGDGAYIPSEKGAQLYAEFTQAYKHKLAEVESLPEAELDQINSLLATVLKAASENADVLQKPALELSLKEIIDSDAALLHKVQLQTVHLLAYRDDAHVASWSPHKLEGYIWESFSDVWAGKSANAAELVEKRPFRRYEEEDYATALNDLVRRGWLKEKGDSYIPTEEGRRVREQAEDLTNQYYDAAWAGVSDAEQDELKRLIQKLIDKHEPEKVSA